VIIIKNRYKIIDDYMILYLEKRNGEVFETKVSLSDFDKLDNLKHKWHVKYAPNNDEYYASATIYLGWKDGRFKNTTVDLQNFLMDGESGTRVDHINHDTLDNRRENLRISTNENNTKHRKGKNKNNSSGYRNVSKVGKWWYVQMQVDGVNTLLKKFPLNELDKAGVYAKEMRNKYYGEFQGAS
jgi:hypothetical protein